MRYALIAGLLSFLFSIGIHLYDCQTGTHEQCLMSAGLFWVYWLGSFLLAWGIVASIGTTIRWFKEIAKTERESPPGP
jgi:hypothetical protein